MMTPSDVCRERKVKTKPSHCLEVEETAPRTIWAGVRRSQRDRKMKNNGCRFAGKRCWRDRTEISNTKAGSGGGSNVYFQTRLRKAEITQKIPK